MKVRSLLMALLLLLSSTAQAGQQSTADQVVEQAQVLFERTINIITQPFVSLSDREIECLARNIFHESASEPLEGKVAVGIVTLNRTADPRFPKDVCGVVKQKTTFSRTKTVTTTQATWYGQKQITETLPVTNTVCQFSWVCHGVKKPRPDDPRWAESQAVAQELAAGGYEHLRVKFADAKHFHAVYVKPSWHKTNRRIDRIGNHIFYE